MSLLPENASFEERVQDCFLAYRGAGVVLSPLDVELIDAWAASEVPFEVVARGIRRAAEAAFFDARPGEGGLRSLRMCKLQVEREMKKHLRSSAGRGEEAGPPEAPPHLLRHAKLKASLRKIGREHPRLQGAVGRILEGALGRAPGDLEEAAAQEERVYALLVRGLPGEDRLGLLREARELAQNGGAISARARKLARRLHRVAVLRRRLGIAAFW